MFREPTLIAGAFALGHPRLDVDQFPDGILLELRLGLVTSMMLELILIAALGVILEWLAQANQSIGVQLHKLPSRNYDFDQLWMKLFLNPVMSIC